MRVVYLAGPYTAKSAAKVHQNILKALAIAQEIWSIPGLCCICPHANTAYFELPGSEEQEYEKFMDGDLEIIKRCDAVVLMPDWDISRGAIRECMEAEKLGKPVFKWATGKQALIHWATHPFKPWQPTVVE